MPALDLSGARWHKSSRSTNNANCVEVAFLDGALWHKSSRSGSVSNCVEVAFAGPVVALRDSKNPSGSVLTIPLPDWTAFTLALRTDDLG